MAKHIVMDCYRRQERSFTSVESAERFVMGQTTNLVKEHRMEYPGKDVHMEQVWLPCDRQEFRLFVGEEEFGMFYSIRLEH